MVLGKLLQGVHQNSEIKKKQHENKREKYRDRIHFDAFQAGYYFFYIEIVPNKILFSNPTDACILEKGLLWSSVWGQPLQKTYSF